MTLLISFSDLIGLKPSWDVSESKKSAYFQDEVDVGGEGLHSVETGDEADGQEAPHVHLSPQEEVPLQVVQAEVVLTTRGKDTRGQHYTDYTDKYAVCCCFLTSPSDTNEVN